MRRRGGSIGPKRSSDLGSGGIWSLFDQQHEQGTGTWNNAYRNITDLVNYGETITLTFANNFTSANMFKAASANSWGGAIRGSIGYTAPCTIEFNKNASVSDDSQSYAMIGWNEDPTTNNSYTDLDYCSYPYQTSGYSVYHSGAPQSVSATWSTALKLYVVYSTDGYIRHYNGSTLLYTSPLYGTNKTVFFDSSFYSVNATNGGFSNVRIAKAAWNGTTYVL